MSAHLKRPAMLVDENGGSPPAKRQLSASLAALKISGQGVLENSESVRSSSASFPDAVQYERPSPFGGANHIATASPFMSSSPPELSFGSRYPTNPAQQLSQSQPQAVAQANDPLVLHMDSSFSSSLDGDGISEQGKDDVDLLLPGFDDTVLSDDGSTENNSSEDLSRALVVYRPPGISGLQSYASAQVVPRPLPPASSFSGRLSQISDNETWFVHHTPECVKRKLAIVPYAGTRKRLFLPTNLTVGPGDSTSVFHDTTPQGYNFNCFDKDEEDVMETL
jgi:hypothetical protein